MKKIIATALSAMMLTSSMTGIAESVSTSYFVDGAISVAGKTTTEVTSIDTGIPGITLNLGADTWIYKDDAKNYNGITYIGRIYGEKNPNPAEGIGTYYEFVCDDTVAQGELEVMYQLNAGKVFFIEDNGTALPDYNGITVTEKATQSSTFTVNPGHTYRVYANGTKLGFYGCTYRVIDREADFAAEIAAFPFDTIKGENADENTIDANLDLIHNYESKFGACDVRWESSNEAVINNAGEVNAQKEETVVELTGIFTVQEDDTLAARKTFTLTVPADADDATAVAAAAEALTLGDTSAVKKDLTLPTAGKKGTTITWATSDETVVTADGVITRYPGQDKTVTLTATVSRGEESTTKDFTVTVLGYVPVTIDTYVYGNVDGSDCYSAVDGGTLKRISYTSSIKTPAEGDVVVAVIYDKDGRMKSCKSIDITAEDYDTNKSAEIGLAMDSTDTFKLTAINAVSLVPYIDFAVANDTVAEGAKIYVVGDSTASVYNDNNYPRKGWAQLLGNYFDDVAVVDYALSGRSSLSFKKEANYTKLQNEIKAGDYLIVQFGHNDSKVGEADRYTDPKTDRFTDGSFKKSMLEYINIARDKGAYPILATSISRRKTSDSSLEAYVNATKELGAEVDVPVLDLYDRTVSWINEVGLEEAKSMFNYVKAKDSRFVSYAGFASSSYYAAGTTDDTHININGADLISQWACEELAEVAHPLADKMNDYKATYPLPSYAEATSVE